MSESIPRKRFVGKAGTNPIKSIPSIPLLTKSIDPLLLATIAALLPSNYNFEIPKTINQIKKNESNRVALQMPEGLLMYGCAIVDIIERFAQVECVIMGDVTYGACCIDDFTARALGCDMMVHYGHSCLVPVDTTTIKTLYVFVEISVDREHLAASIRLNFPQCIPSAASIGSAKGKGPELEIEIEPSTTNKTLPLSNLPTKLALVGTIQFVAAVQGLKLDLEKTLIVEPQLSITDGVEQSTSQLIETAIIPTFEVTVPQIKPLSPGEILGCTAPRLSADIQAIVYVGDGRFHLESIMIANPLIPAFRYDPYTKRLTRELYEHEEMRRLRGKAVELAKSTLQVRNNKEKKDSWAVVLGTLGRQGNLRVLRSITRHLGPETSSTVSTTSLTSTPFIPILLSELSPAKLSLFTGISTFVQTSCPRLSIDWGYAFSKPLLSSYEASVALGVSGARGWSGMGVPTFIESKEDYPMDFYADGSLGDWTPRHGMGIKKSGGEKGRPMPKRRTATAIAV